MKKKLFIGAILLLSMLAGCSDKEDSIQPDAAEEQDTAIKPQTEELVPTGFKNTFFTKDENKIFVKGEAKAENGAFYYKVETQEGKELLPEKKVELPHPHAYLPYEFELNRSKLEKVDVSILKLYGKDEEGKTSNPNYIPVEPKDIHDK